MKTFIDMRISERGGRLAVRTAFQAPSVSGSALLPFTASDGTVVAASPTGVPFVATKGDGFAVFLRTDACPLSLWNGELAAPVPAARVSQAARASKRAVAEFRGALRARA